MTIMIGMVHQPICIRSIEEENEICGSHSQSSLAEVQSYSLIPLMFGEVLQNNSDERTAACARSRELGAVRLCRICLSSLLPAAVRCVQGRTVAGGSGLLCPALGCDGGNAARAPHHQPDLDGRQGFLLAGFVPFLGRCQVQVKAQRNRFLPQARVVLEERAFPLLNDFVHFFCPETVKHRCFDPVGAVQHVTSGLLLKCFTE